MGWIELIAQAMSLTGNILTYIKDSRGWEMKKDVENLLEEISEQEKMVGHLRDDQLLDELRDDLTRKLKLFNSYLGSQSIQPKDD